MGESRGHIFGNRVVRCDLRNPHFVHGRYKPNRNDRSQIGYRDRLDSLRRHLVTRYQGYTPNRVVHSRLLNRGRPDTEHFSRLSASALQAADFVLGGNVTFPQWNIEARRWGVPQS
jgi:hypothetical protein